VDKEQKTRTLPEIIDLGSLKITEKEQQKLKNTWVKAAMASDSQTFLNVKNFGLWKIVMNPNTTTSHRNK